MFCNVYILSQVLCNLLKHKEMFCNVYILSQVLCNLLKHKEMFCNVYILWQVLKEEVVKCPVYWVDSEVMYYHVLVQDITKKPKTP